MAETSKAHERRQRAGWYAKYFSDPKGQPVRILDVGSGIDPLPIKGTAHWDNYWAYDENESGLSWRVEQSNKDALTLEGIEDESFDVVYSSHLLEHMRDPVQALRNWWRVLNPYGYLIVAVPHRDLYEKRTTHPSRWNPRNADLTDGHINFFLPNRAEEPDTLSLLHTIREAIPDAVIMEFTVQDDGYDYTTPPEVHGVGEYSIEVVLRKLW